MFTLVSEEKYEDGQIIFKENSSGDWVYVVISGSVEIFKMIGDKKLVIEVLREGEVFGEMSFIGEAKRTATVKAIGETTVGIIDRDSLDQEFNKLSSDFRSILVALVRRFKKTTDRIVDFNDRVAPRVLKSLSVSYKDRQNFFNAYTTNISNGGLFIKTGNALAQGEEFLLKLNLPDLPEALKIRCKVAWTRKKESDADQQVAGMGIQFLEMNKQDNRFLQDYIKSSTRSESA